MTNSDEDAEARLTALEVAVLEQEHRLLQVLYNVFVVRPSLQPEDKRRGAILKALIFYFFSPRTAVAIGLGTAGVIGVLFAWQANVLLARQNEKIDVQNQLAEASRRAALVFELTSINEAIEDLADGEGLSRSIVGRIVAISRSFRPYLFVALETDRSSDFGVALKIGQEQCTGPARTTGPLFLEAATLGSSSVAVALTERPLSPERGQLLISLVTAGYNDLSEVIDAGLDLRYADLRGGVIESAVLPNVDVQHSTFEGARIFNSQLNNADLSSADFHCANALGLQARGASALEVNFELSRLNKAVFDGAYLKGANFSGAFIPMASFTDAYLEDVDFDGAIVCAASEGCQDWVEQLGATSRGFSPDQWHLVREHPVGHPWADPTTEYMVVRPNSAP